MTVALVSVASGLFGLTDAYTVRRNLNVALKASGNDPPRASLRYYRIHKRVVFAFVLGPNSGRSKFDFEWQFDDGPTHRRRRTRRPGRGHGHFELRPECSPRGNRRIHEGVRPMKKSDQERNEVACTNCGRPVSRRTKICPSCGIRMPEQYERSRVWVGLASLIAAITVSCMDT